MTTESVSRAAAEALFLAELETTERAIRFACRRASFFGADAEDFGSYVKLKLIENDYGVIRKFEGRQRFGHSSASWCSVCFLTTAFTCGDAGTRRQKRSGLAMLQLRSSR